jgi:glucans biosynthesis protein C
MQQTFAPSVPDSHKRQAFMKDRHGRSYWMDYLRGFITVLVVAHHSTLAYTTFAHFNPQAYMASTHPIVDNVRSIGLDIFEDFNDVFFMALMFLISGIFVVPSLERKGQRQFIRDRTKRLFIPFLITVTLIIPFGYLASWRLAHGNYDLRAFFIDFIRVEHWPAGPPWFIGILFIFNGIVCLFYPRLRGLLQRWNAHLTRLSNRPGSLFWRGYLLTLGLYIPLVLIFGYSAWIGFGPFAIQLSRILLYFGYFMLGLAIGVTSINEGLLAESSALARYAWRWVGRCLLAYGLLKIGGLYIGNLANHGRLTEIEGRLLYRPIWALSCTLSCMAFLAVFRRIFHSAKRGWESLASNAYGIYLAHYVFVLWLQYLLLPVDLPAVAKFAVTFIGSLGLSWAVTALVRRIPLVGKYL